MRDRVLQRIEEIRLKEGNFDKQTMRWRNAEFGGKHYSLIDFKELNDEYLAQVFEMMVYRFYKCM